jgi:hypothetical protein
MIVMSRAKRFTRRRLSPSRAVGDWCRTRKTNLRSRLSTAKTPLVRILLVISLIENESLKLVFSLCSLFTR